MARPNGRQSATGTITKVNSPNGTNSDHGDPAGSRIAPNNFMRDRDERRCAETVAVRALPADAADIAREYANKLAAPKLYEPLGRFLADVATVQGIEAIALAAWQEPTSPPHLSVYAVTDRNRLNPPGGGGGSRAAVRRAYGVLDQTVRAESPPLSCGLSWVNTRGEAVSCVLSTLEAEFAADHFLTVAPSRASIVLLTFAAPDGRS